MKKKQTDEEMKKEFTKLIQIMDREILEVMLPMARRLVHGSSCQDELMERMEKTGFICR